MESKKKEVEKNKWKIDILALCSTAGLLMTAWLNSNQAVDGMLLCWLNIFFLLGDIIVTIYYVRYGIVLARNRSARL